MGEINTEEKPLTHLSQIYAKYKGDRFISFSQLSLWMNCPKKWELMYVGKKIKVEPNLPIMFGRALHETIQAFFRKAYNSSAKEARDMNLMGMFFAKFLTEIKKAKEKYPHLEFNKHSEYFASAGSILKYVKGTKFAPYVSRKNYKLVGIEIPFHIDVSEDEIKVHFVGALDIVLQENKSKKYLILDLKITTKGWSQWKKGDDSLYTQLVLYKYYYAQQLGVSPDDVMIRYVIFRRDINFEYLDFPLKRLQEFIPPSGKPTFNKINNKLKEFVGVVKDPTKHSFPAIAGVKSANCKYCDFKDKEDLCPLKNRIVHS